MKAFFRIIRQFSHSNVNPHSRQVESGNTCSSVCSPKWGQCTVNSQMSVGQGRCRKKEKKKSMRFWVSVSRWVPACDVRMRGKNSLAPLPSSDRKTAARRDEGREGKMEREGEGEGLVWSKVFPQQYKNTHSHRCTDSASPENVTGQRAMGQSGVEEKKK